jgi:hypothetical protein
LARFTLLEIARNASFQMIGFVMFMVPEEMEHHDAAIVDLLNAKRIDF